MAEADEQDVLAFQRDVELVRALKRRGGNGVRLSGAQADRMLELLELLRRLLEERLGRRAA